MTASEQAKLEHIAQMSPEVLSAIENNREELMTILDKIYAEMSGGAIDINFADPEAEESSSQADIQTLESMRAVLIGIYLMSFMSQELPDIGPALQQAHDNGALDGMAYNTFKKMRRH